MTTAIDNKLRTFIGNLQHEAVDEVAAGSGQSHKRASAQPPPPVRKHPAARPRPVSSPPSDQRRGSLYIWIAAALIVLLLIATGVAYYLHRVDRAAIASRIDAIVRAPLTDPLEARFSTMEKKLIADSSANKIRLQAFEQRLIENQQAHRQQLQEMEQRLVQMHEPQEQRLQQVEQRLARPQQPDLKRMQAIENRLVQITARMDGWAGVVADLSDDDQSVSPLPAATAAEPPVERAIEPVMVTRNNAVLQPPKSLPDTAQDEPPLAAAAVTAPGAQGDWVINIGSYVREKIAARKLAEFRKQGVNAAMETATVRGKTIYRVQVPGFISMAEARDHARQVRETLGLKETWIRHR